MSCIRCNGFFIVTSMYCCCKGYGWYELLKMCNFFLGFICINVVMFLKFGSVVERLIKWIIFCVVLICRIVFAMMDSSMGLWSLCKRWILLMMISLMSCVYMWLLDFWVIIFYFFGVVMMICVVLILVLFSETLFVNFRIWILKVFKWLFKLFIIFVMRVFIGVIYMILNVDVLMFLLWWWWRLILCKIVNIV